MRGSRSDGGEEEWKIKAEPFPRGILLPGTLPRQGLLQLCKEQIRSKIEACRENWGPRSGLDNIKHLCC